MRRRVKTSDPGLDPPDPRAKTVSNNGMETTFFCIKIGGHVTTLNTNIIDNIVQRCPACQRKHLLYS